MTDETTIAPRAYSPAAFCAAFGIGSTTFYEQLKAGRLSAVKIGRRTIVPAEEAERWLSSLPALESAAA